jgi:hypothetical protein
MIPTALAHSRFVNWVALVGATWLILQGLWWIWWYATHEGCAGGRVPGVTPFILFSTGGVLLTAAFWRLVVRRRRTLGLDDGPVWLAIALYLAQTAVILAGDWLWLECCLQDRGNWWGPQLIFFVLWAVIAALSLGLALRNLYMLLTMGR